MHSGNDYEYILDNIDIEKLAGTKIVITGSSGFIGYNLVNTLRYANQTVLKENQCIVYGLDINQSNDECKDNIHFIKHDVTKPTDLYSECDYIIHAASIASPIKYREKPLETVYSNVRGLENILKTSNKNKSILYFSSSEIYGNPPITKVPTSEEYNGNVSCIGPRACYDETKRYCEMLCSTHKRKYNSPIKIVRPFNNYGPGLDINDGRVVSDFCNNLINKEDIIILSDGNPSRTFCYIADAVIGYFKILLYEGEEYIFNIGNDKELISVYDLADMLMKIGRNHFGININVQRKLSNDKDYNVDCPLRRCPDISKAKELLDYNPKIELVEGLKRSIRWYLDK